MKVLVIFSFLFTFSLSLLQYWILFINMNCESQMSGNIDTVMPTKCLQYSSMKKSKRYRSAFTTDQISYLEREFRKFPYIGSGHRKEVASVLKISERAVKIWFQNRRMKEKREVSNKESITDDTKKNNDVLPNKQKNLISNMHSNKAKLVFNNSLQTSQHTFLKEPGNEATNTFTVENKPLHKKSNEKTVYQTKSNLTNKVITLMQKIRNNKIKSSHKNINQCINYKSFNRTEKQHINEMKSSISLPNTKHREQAQDLSLNRNRKTQPFYSVQSKPDRPIVPIYTQNYLQPTTGMHSGSLLWKPVSLMPMMPGLASLSIGNVGFSSSNHDITNGSCNCHGPPHTFNAQSQCSARLQPQYILAIPFSNQVQKI